MMNDSSLGGADIGHFDLDSQKGVTHLLASVRASAISVEQKNELRDLIFLYANGGKDQSVRITLEHKIASYGVVSIVVPVPEKVEEKVEEVSRPAFGASRPAPSFTPKVVSPTQEPTPTPMPQPEVVIPTPTPILEPVAEVIPEPIPEVASETVPPEPVLPVEELKTEVPIPVVEPVQPEMPEFVPEPEVVIPTQTPIPEPVAEIIPEPTPEPAAVPSTQSYDPNTALQRIREIKSLVNDRVGNPVNLVDIDNEVGREYMGALLDAMKKLNNGSSAISAMKRLETAYTVVEKTLADYDSKKESAVDETPTPAPVEVINESIVQESVVEIPKPLPVEPIPEPEQIVPPVVEMPIEEVVENVPEVVVPRPEPLNVELNKVVDAKPAQPEPAREYSIPIVPIQSQYPAAEKDSAKIEIDRDVWGDDSLEKKPEPLPEKPKVTEVANEIGSAWGESTDTVQAAPKVNNSGATASLSESLVKPKTLNDLPLASALETSSVAGDPLFTNEVDEGLNQLLVEWVLFKKSGLFGTGPKGREHPLFKKLAPLQIPLLLAGRFEGATQEIKQSITDYMNGWRYEQGIIYNQGETFEHYLRRVIRHILDLQN